MGTCCSRRNARGKVRMVGTDPGKGTVGLHVEGWSGLGPGRNDMAPLPHVDGWSSLGPGRGDAKASDVGLSALGPGNGICESRVPFSEPDPEAGQERAAWASGTEPEKSNLLLELW